MLELLGIYVLRFLNMLMIEVYESVYVDWMYNSPISFITISFLFHILYDGFPMV